MKTKGTRKSIMQKDSTKCFICGKSTNLETHHVIGGFGYRHLSEAYGLKVKICRTCHVDITDKRRDGKANDTMLKIEAQKAFIMAYPDSDFLSVFGKSYL
jgi:5-methylcytosine-specific restriction endonuclease McrA